MSTFDLSLPDDIDWKRRCTSEYEPIPCKDDTMPWTSSMTIYTHEVESEEAEPEKRVTYIKIVVSFCPTAFDYTKVHPILTWGYDDLSWLPPLVLPIHSALLRVGVSPVTADLGFPKIDYPHFSQLEPKKRELIELKSSTEELLTGSASSIEVGKSTTNLRQTENTTGFSLGYGGTGFNSGSTRRRATQTTESTNTDNSTERRETMSHTTQTSQLYTLLQSWHQGTNRALFLVEPRPHILSSDQYFLGGVRKLEGIQEFFLVVERPYAMEDFCIDARLLQAHAIEEQTYEYEYADWKSKEFEFKYGSPFVSNAPWAGTKHEAVVLTLDSDASFDMDNKEIVGIDFITKQPEGISNVTASVTSANTIGLEFDAQWDYFRTNSDGKLNSLNANVKLVITARVKRKKLSSTKITKYLTSVTELCCCPEEDEGDGRILDWPKIIGEEPIDHHIPIVTQDPSSPEVVNNLRYLQTFLRERLIADSAKANTEEIPLEASNVVLSKVAEKLNQINPTGELDKQVGASSIIESSLRNKLAQIIPNKSVGQLLGYSSQRLAGALQTSLSNVVQMKQQIVGAISPKPQIFTTKPVGIIGVRMGSTYTPGGIYGEIANVKSPSHVQYIRANSNVNRIQVEFGDIPDAGTVTTSSLKLLFNGSALPATVTQITTSTWQLELTTPILASGQYQLVAVGTGGSPITFSGAALDGEAFGFPTGNGVAGSDFVMNLALASIPVIPPVVPLPLIVVSGVRIQTTVPTLTTIFTMINPMATVQLAASQSPNRIRVNFNLTPDAGTVTGSTFIVETAAGAVAGTVTITGSEAVFAPTVAFALDTLHTVRLKGTTPSITYSTRKLDGEPYAIPSGNQTEGSDFYFSFIINSAL